MKKRILVFSAGLATFSLSAFGYMKWKEEGKATQDNFVVASVTAEEIFGSIPKAFEFAYSIDNRFLRSIKMEKITTANSVLDILPEEENRDITSFHHIKITALAEERKDWIVIPGKNEMLNEAQLQILRSMKYGSSFSITGNIKRRNTDTDKIIDDTLVYYLTVEPHRPATYLPGRDELINYLMTNSKSDIAIAEQDKIQPGKVSFVLTRNGNIDQIKLTSSSGYPGIDEKMLTLIENIPGNWQVATNTKGEKVDQELVFFFGSMGC